MFKSKKTHFKFTCLIIACTLSSCASVSREQHRLERFERASSAVRAAEKELVFFRHDLHRHPELAGEERRTSMKVIEQLNSLGYDVQADIGGYGVVAMLEGPAGGPVIAFRADMDAFPDSSIDTVPYASEIQGVRHICGHDVHTTIAIGLAIGLAEIQDDLPGTIMLIFQPAEETGTGAKAMLSDGLFVARKPDAILALHTSPYNLGQLASMPGGMMAGRALVTVNLKGSGNLEEADNRVRNALTGVATVTGDELFAFGPSDFVAVNIFPNSMTTENSVHTVQGFVMSAGLERREKVKERVLESLSALTLDGIEMEVSYEQALEGVNNDVSLLAAASGGISALTSDIAIQTLPGVVPAFSEDFGSFQRETPGAMYFLGVSNPETGTVGFPHTPEYVADDAAILIGTRAMLAATLTLMEQE